MSDETFFNGVASEGDFANTNIVQKEGHCVDDDPEQSMLVQKNHEQGVVNVESESENSSLRSRIITLEIETQELKNEKLNMEASLSALQSGVDELKNEMKEHFGIMEKTMAEIDVKKDNDILELKKGCEELKMKLQKQSFEFERAMKKKKAEQSKTTATKDEIVASGEKENNGLMVQWQDAAIAAGLVASVTMVYLVFAKRG